MMLTSNITFYGPDGRAVPSEDAEIEDKGDGVYSIKGFKPLKPGQHTLVVVPSGPPTNPLLQTKWSLKAMEDFKAAMGDAAETLAKWALACDSLGMFDTTGVSKKGKQTLDRYGVQLVS
jgi:hypothetical protein